MTIVFDKRMVQDDDLWSHVDAFTLDGDNPTDQAYFTVETSSANRRRYAALHYMLILCLGNQFGKLIAASEGDFDWDQRESFQEAFLRCSLDKARKKLVYPAAPKLHLFGFGKLKEGDRNAFEEGRITEQAAQSAVNFLMTFSKGRKEGFGASKTILYDLDVLQIDENFAAAVDLTERIVHNFSSH